MTANKSPRRVLCRLDEQRYALPADTVDRVLPAMALQPPARSHGWVCGVVHVQGEAVTVLDIRRRFGHPVRGPLPDDVLVLARSGAKRVGFFVDAVEGVDDDDSPSAGCVNGIDGSTTGADGTVLIHDIDRAFELSASAIA